MCEWCRPVMYRSFIWMGAKRIQQVMEAKGYIIGTSQVVTIAPAPVALSPLWLPDHAQRLE